MAEDNEDIGMRSEESDDPIVAMNPGNQLDGTWRSEGGHINTNRGRDRCPAH